MNIRNARTPRSTCPGKVAIRHAIEAARAAGLDGAGIEVCADGTIRVMDARQLPQRPDDLFERLKAAGEI